LCCTEGVGSSFHVLRSRTHFQRYQVCRVPVSYFALPDLFWAISRAPGLVFIYCAFRPILTDTEGVGSSFLVLGYQTRFRWYRELRVQFSGFAPPDPFSAVLGAPGLFSCFVLPNSFPTVPRASDPVFCFCAPKPVFGGIESGRYIFDVLLTRTLFRPYRVRRVQFSCFALPNSFPTVVRGLRSHFHVL
jgi:hypothetical protein